jgi:hypothetical protein
MDSRRVPALFVVCFIGMSMQKQEAEGDEDLLAIPPKKS